MSISIDIFSFMLQSQKNNYEGNEIPFRIDENGEVFMNATEMGKHFKGKSVANFLRNKSTVEYINALHEEKDVMRIRISTDSPLIQKVIGKGKEQGTWFQRNLALEFARWLNPKFSVWCNQRIDEIITKGFSALTPEARILLERFPKQQTMILTEV